MRSDVAVKDASFIQHLANGVIPEESDQSVCSLKIGKSLDS